MRRQKGFAGNRMEDTAAMTFCGIDSYAKIMFAG